MLTASRLAAVVTGLLFLLGTSLSAAQLGSGFTYQGQLQEGSVPTAASTCDFQFSLFDAASGGSQVGALQSANGVPVDAGIFTVELNGAGEFGPTAFDGSDRWLQIAVRCPGGGGSFSPPFAPRQKLTAAPNALYAQAAGDVSCSGCVAAGDLQPGAVGASQIGDGQINTAKLGDGQVTSGKILDGAVGTADLAAGGVTTQKIAPGSNGQVLTTSGGATAWQFPSIDWGLTGNAGTNSTNFLGTTDLQPLRLAVNGRTGFRLLPAPQDPDLPNVVGGDARNAVVGDVFGATIAGGNGDESGDPTCGNPGTVGLVARTGNMVSDSMGTIGGGLCNFVGNGDLDYDNATYGVVAGGVNNVASGANSTIGGGASNKALGGGSTIAGGFIHTAGGIYASVGGGRENQATGNRSTVAGGTSNVASGDYSAVPGGGLNLAAGSYAFAAGRRAKANHAGAFVWADSTDADFNSTQSDSFNVRATKGVRLAKNAGPDGIGLSTGQYYRDNAIVSWGRININGTIDKEFGVSSVQHPAVGQYVIIVDVNTQGSGSLVPVANAEVDAPPASASAARLVTINQHADDTFYVYITNGSYQLVDNDFTFIVTGRGDE